MSASGPTRKEGLTIHSPSTLTSPSATSLAATVRDRASPRDARAASRRSSATGCGRVPTLEAGAELIVQVGQRGGVRVERPALYLGEAGEQIRLADADADAVAVADEGRTVPGVCLRTPEPFQPV